MTKELLNCPVCCGNKLQSYGIGGNTRNPPMDTIVKCLNRECMIYDIPFSVNKWNRRAGQKVD